MIGCGELVDEEVARQARDADEHTEDRGQNTADDRDAERIDETDQQCLPIGRCGRVLDHAFADVETRCAPQELPARLDLANLEIVHHVRVQVPAGAQ